MAAVLLTAASGAEAGPETYPLEKVRRGQTGYGFTTFKGGTPERFTFEVVSVLKNYMPKMDLVVVKSDDKKLERSGFWQGMSGSPLYLEDKLMCAFSYGWRFNKMSLGGCTPIQYMKQEGLETVRRFGPGAVQTNGNGNGQNGGKSRTPTKRATTPTQKSSMVDWRRLTPTGDVAAALGPARQPWITQTPLPPAAKAKQIQLNSNPDETMAASVPLAAAGFSNESFAALESVFGGFNVDPIRAGGTAVGDDTAPTELKMGGSISVVLARGDMSLAATGTVSYIDGSKVLAFGHPMFQLGEIYAPVSTAYVHTVVPSGMMAFVVASPAKEVGSLVQDRQSMIMADTTLRDPMIPVDIFITAKNGSRTEKGEFHTQILENKFFTGALAGMMTMNAINYYYPDRDHVTAKIDSTVAIKGFGSLSFTDYLYANDGATSVVGGARALRAIGPLLMNPFAPVEISRVEVKVDMRFTADYADIKELRLPAQMLRPGKRTMVTVVMDTYGGGEITEDVAVDVPKELAGAVVNLEIQPGDAARVDAPPPTDVPSLLGVLRKMLPGNTWAATLSMVDEGISVDGKVVKDLPAAAHDRLHPGSRSQRVQSYRPIARTVTPAKRVLNGSASTMVRIADK
jgi:hypothetical protein